VVPQSTVTHSGKWLSKEMILSRCFFPFQDLILEKFTAYFQPCTARDSLRPGESLNHDAIVIIQLVVLFSLRGTFPSS
jgi:hypothetical protein